MEEQNLRLQEVAKQYVHTMGRWYKFFGILAIVGCVFMVIGALIMFATGSVVNSMMEDAEMYNAGMATPQIPTVLMAVIYLIGVGIEVPIIIYMLRGAKAAETAVALNSNEAAVEFLSNSKSYWKYYGILTIVVLAICIIAVPVVAVAAAAAAL